MAPISIPIAIDAGLGQLGRMGLIVTPKYGPRVRLAKVITDMPLVPNDPKVHAEQLTRLRCPDGTWKAELDCRLHVTEGVVDEIRIEAPSPWDGPYRIEADPPVAVAGRKRLCNAAFAAQSSPQSYHSWCGGASLPAARS